MAICHNFNLLKFTYFLAKVLLAWNDGGVKFMTFRRFVAVGCLLFAIQRHFNGTSTLLKQRFNRKNKYNKNNVHTNIFIVCSICIGQESQCRQYAELIMIYIHFTSFSPYSANQALYPRLKHPKPISKPQVGPRPFLPVNHTRRKFA